MSLRDAIKAADDGTAEEYEVPEWGVTIEVRSLTARARSILHSEWADDHGDAERAPHDAWWQIVSKTCFDPDTGKLIFDDDDEDMFLGKNAQVVTNLANFCMKASGMTKEAQDDLGKGSSGSPTPEDDLLLSDDSTSG